MTAEDLAAVHAACFDAPRPWSAVEFTKILGMPHVFLLTQDGGFLVGRAVGGEAELLTLAVPKAARKQGIGALLLEAFLHQARLLGTEDAFLEVAHHNEAAIALYKKFGFSKVAERKAYMTDVAGLKHDAYIMRREIGHDAS